MVAPVWRWFGIKIEIKGSDHSLYRLVTVLVLIVFVYALFHEELWSSWWLLWWALWAAMQMQKLYEVCGPNRAYWRRDELDPAAKKRPEEAAARSLKKTLTR